MITYVNQGSAGVGVGSAAVPFPTGIVAGNALLLIVGSKYPPNAPQTPDGWTLLEQTPGGVGIAETDNGPVYCSVYLRQADGTESGTVLVTAPGGDAVVGVISKYRSYGPVSGVAVGVANDVASTAWAVTFGRDPGIIGGDFCIAASAVNTNDSTMTTGNLTVPGVTFGTQGGNVNVGSTIGDDIRVRTSHHFQTTGTSTGVASYAMTGVGGAPSGASVLIVLREAAVQYAGRGVIMSGTTSLAIPYPTGIAAGDILACSIVSKYPPNVPALPADWTLTAQVTGGTATDGPDNGHTCTTLFTKRADGTETGNLAITLTSGNSALGMMSRYARAGFTLGVAGAGGASSTPALAWSATMTTNPGIVAGDLVVALSGVNTDANTFSAEALAATGATFDTAVEINDSGTTSGDDCRLVLSHHMCLTGAASAPPVFTMTSSGTDSSTQPAGSTAMLVIRASEIAGRAVDAGGMNMGIGIGI